MSRWQRILRLLLGLFAIGFAVVVYFAINERRPADGGATTARTDPQAVAESTGGQTMLAKGTAEDYTVKYSRARTYQDGSMRFDDVTVNVPGRQGRDFVVAGKEAEVRNNQSTVHMKGDVKLTASDGLTATAGEASFDNGEGVLRVPGPLTFSRGRLAGTSVGGTYDRTRDVLWLLDQAHITLAPDTTGAGDVDITAGAAGYARRDRYMRFERGVRIVRTGQVVEAEGAVAYLAPDTDRIQMVELRGSSRVTRPESQPGGLQSMTSRDMNLEYADDGQTLEKAVLAGGSAIQMLGAPQQPGRRLSGDVMELIFAPNGTTVINLVARDGVQLDMPADENAVARHIKSTTLEASGPPDVGIQSARFADNVEFTERRFATKTDAAIDRVARSRTLNTVVGAGFSDIQAAEFGGGVTFEDGALDATAPTATYAVSKGTLNLVAGPPGTPAARVSDERATIDARTIDLTIEGRGMVADGDVRSLMKPASKEPAPAPGGATRAVRRPGLLRDDQAANVTGKHLAYDSSTGKAVYTGEARLWQGETAVQGDTLTIDDSQGNLQASGSVKSTLRLEQTDQKTGKREPKTSVVTSGELLYEDAARRATYTTNARLVGPEGDLRADKIEMYLVEGGGELERLEAYGKVSLRSQNRASTGTRLTYYAADGRYVMGGAPVRVLEQLPTECRETIGKILTFFRSTDTISVDGNEEGRTQTTSGGKCQEPRTS